MIASARTLSRILDQDSRKRHLRFDFEQAYGLSNSTMVLAAPRGERGDPLPHFHAGMAKTVVEDSAL